VFAQVSGLSRRDAGTRSSRGAVTVSDADNPTGSSPTATATGVSIFRPGMARGVFRSCLADGTGASE
jgi:hypothetical protein